MWSRPISDSKTQQACRGSVGLGQLAKQFLDGSESQRVLEAEHGVDERSMISPLELGEVALLKTGTGCELLLSHP
jgi:hypothetical protein